MCHQRGAILEEAPIPILGRGLDKVVFSIQISFQNLNFRSPAFGAYASHAGDRGPTGRVVRKINRYSTGTGLFSRKGKSPICQT